MTIVVGFDGFIGSALTAGLLERGHRVLGVRRSGCYRVKPGGENVLLGVEEMHDQLSSERQTVVFCAGKGMPYLDEGEAEIRDEEFDLAKYWLELSRRYGCRFIYLSTIAVESDEDSLYLSLKRRVEALIEEYAIESTVYRLCSVFGPNQKVRLLFDLLSKISTTEGTITMRGAGTEKRSWIFLPALVGVLCNVVSHTNEHQHSFTGAVAVYGRTCTVRSFCEAVMAISAPNRRLEFSEADRIGATDLSFLSSSRPSLSAVMPPLNDCLKACIESEG